MSQGAGVSEDPGRRAARGRAGVPCGRQLRGGRGHKAVTGRDPERKSPVTAKTVERCTRVTPASQERDGLLV